MGGKSLLANKIIPRIPAHRCYCEVFAGAAWLLFRKEESRVEIINDINVDLVTLYRVIKLHLEEFIRYLKWLLVARDEFERFREEKPETLTDIQRAVRFFYLLKSGYGGRIRSPVISISPERRSSFNLLRIEEELSWVHLRLARVYIENKDYAEVIRRFDRPGTFFYVDPPYYGCENYYGKGIFCREDFQKLRDLLAGIKGKFILSINDLAETRNLFKGFRIETERTIYSLPKVGVKRVSELLVSNFAPERRVVKSVHKHFTSRLKS
jgi:DNA adenine methylase